MITSTKLTSNFPLCDTMYVFSTYSDIGCACGMPTSRVECWCIFWLVYKDKVVIILPFFYLFSACIYVVVSCFPLIKTYFMDVFNMTYVKYKTVYKLKKTSKNHPVYEDKSDSRRKVVIVRRTLI